MNQLINTIKNYLSLFVSFLVGGSLLLFWLIDLNDNWFKGILYCYLTYIIVFKSIEIIRTIKSGRFGVDILAIMAIVSCIFTGDMVAAYIIGLMISSGEALETLAGQRAKRELSALIKRQPTRVHLVSNDDVVEVELDKLKVGDIVLVKANEVVPIDGRLIDQAAVMDESSLTGESTPVSKVSGDQLISGTVNLKNSISIKATTNANNSYYAQLIRYVKSMDEQPSRFVSLSNRYAVAFTIISLVIAVTSWIISGNVQRLTQVLVVASPCPLLLAAPIAFVSGMAKCSKNGIIVKSGSALELTAIADTFAFDKTGTITDSQITVSRVESTSDYTRTDLLSIAAAIELASTHVLATCLVNYAKSKNIKPANITSIREVTGRGLFARLGRKRIVLGSLSFLASNKITGLPNSGDQLATYVAVNGKLAGIIYFTETIRPGINNTIRKLRSLGVKHCLILTGDRHESALRVGQQIQVTKVFSELKPQDKVAVVRQYQANSHRVVMVGDGINDAPVLAAADVGIAVCAMEATVASDTADVVISGNRVNRIYRLRQIARQTLSIAQQSILIGVFLCLILELVAAFGYLPAMYGAISQEVIDLLAIVNALRALR